jgi:uncharacterized protein RhaS with RHS repeats
MNGGAAALSRQSPADPDGDGQTVSLRVRFPGQYEDVETGLHYNLCRY